MTRESLDFDLEVVMAHVCVSKPSRQSNKFPGGVPPDSCGNKLLSGTESYRHLPSIFGSSYTLVCASDKSKCEVLSPWKS